LAGAPKFALEEATLPQEVIIPLRQGFGEEVAAVVKAGERVRAGQIVGIDDASCSSPVHATANGTVKDVRAISRFGQETGAVIIESNGSSDWARTDVPETNLENSSTDEISRALYLSGVASLGRYGFPTQHNTSALKPDDVTNLVINAVYSEPFTLSNRILLSGSMDKFLGGVDILRRALPNEVGVYIGIDDRDGEIIKELETATWLNVHPLKAKYPQGHDTILVRTILGNNAQAVVMDVQSALHAYEAAVEGKPVMERVLALGGSGLTENLFLKVWVGTPVEYIITSRMRNTESRCIYGGIITGLVCDDLSFPVDRTVSSIAVLEEDRDRQFLSFLRPGINRDSFSNTFLSSLFPMAGRNMNTNEHGEHRPCVYCNYCENVCPVGLMPYLLSKYVTRDMMDEADRHRITTCIDCGLCTYVCLSKIPLMTHIQEGKSKLMDGEAGIQRSDQLALW
jgi:Na(+)-translocating NADH:ubiquinone oxidoreductase A subunit